MIVNLRGTNGSGKSTVARSLLAGAREVELAPYTTARGAARRVVGYHAADLGLVIVGPYRTECGGCDAVKTQNLVCESVRLAARLAPNVLFEGVIVSTLFSRYLELSRELGGLTWAYLDTPLDVCLARIAARNGGKAIKEDLVADKHRAIARTADKARAAGEWVVAVPSANALETVRRLFAREPLTVGFDQ